MEQWDRVVTDPRLRLAGAERHLLGPKAANATSASTGCHTMSGSTGLRGVFAYTAEEFATWLAVRLRGLARSGVTPSRASSGSAPRARSMSRSSSSLPSRADATGPLSSRS